MTIKNIDSSLRVFICSDLHIDFMSSEERETFSLPDADVYLIAGDTMNGVKAHFCDWIKEKTVGKPTYLIPGNHEYYGLRRDKALRRLNEYFADSNVTVLLDSYCEIIPGLAIYGTDYWTDMDLYGDIINIKRLAKSKMNDYHAITFKNQNSFRKLAPDNTIEWHHNAKKKLVAFTNNYKGKYILMTHHGVSRDCLPLRGDGTRGYSELDPLYTSDGKDFISSLSNKPILCINGHMHHFNNTETESIPILANPRGYKGILSQCAIELDLSEGITVSKASLKLYKPTRIERAYVFMWEDLAGTLYRDEEDVLFEYDSEYLENGGAPVSLSLPFRKEPYINAVRFKTLLSERELAHQAQVTGYPESDYLSILATAKLDLPGAIDVREK